MEPIAPYVVITGRMYGDFAHTLQQIGGAVAIYMRPADMLKTEDVSGVWKAHMINLLGVEEFYEDRPEQAAIIRRDCPNYRVIMVE